MRDISTPATDKSGSEVNAQIFSASVTNPFDLTATGIDTHSTFADLDGDGDLDLLTASYGDSSSSSFNYYQNIGTSKTPKYAPKITNPFNLDSNIGSGGNPSFVDLDNDGDMDLMVGNYDGNSIFFLNTGTRFSPLFGQ